MVMVVPDTMGLHPMQTVGVVIYVDTLSLSQEL